MAAVSPTTPRIAGDRSDAERRTDFTGGAATFGAATSPGSGRVRELAAERPVPVARPGRPVAVG